MARFKAIKITKNMDINVLRKEVERANRIYNRRINELREYRLALLSPSYYIHKPNGESEIRKIRHVQTSVLSREQLEKEYINFKSFLDNKTSTVSGVKKYRAKMRKTLKLEKGDTLFSSDLSTARKRAKAIKRERKFWEMYNNSNEVLKANLPSDRIIKMLRKITKQKHLTEQDKMDLFDKYLQKLNNSYDKDTKNFELNDDTFIIDFVKKK